RASLPRFQREAAASNRRIVELISDIAERKGCTPAQLSLAWLLAQGDDIVPIPGTKRIGYLHDNTEAVYVSLSDNELHEIREGLRTRPVVGERYTDEGMKGVDV
ncbi:MAG: aldo/keto reductase, partial [Pseudomonadales bacterium]